MDALVRVQTEGLNDSMLMLCGAVTAKEPSVLEALKKHWLTALSANKLYDRVFLEIFVGIESRHSTFSIYQIIVVYYILIRDHTARCSHYFYT